MLEGRLYQMGCLINQDCSTNEKLRRGLCGKHYRRWRKHGDPRKTVRIFGDDETRFWSYVKKASGCWLWVGAFGNSGYGQMGHNTERGYQLICAHRFSWELHNGSISQGLCVLHRCDNPRCVRPDHLFLGSRADNARDRDQKGRMAAKIDYIEANRIRESYATGRTTQRQLGIAFGLSNQQISRIVRGKRWKTA